MAVLSYTLFKNPVQPDTLAVVQYLFHLRAPAVPLPSACVERNHPAWVTRLPSIETADGARYHGIDGCVAFFEGQTGIDGLLAKALDFKARNPSYRIGDDGDEQRSKKLVDDAIRRNVRQRGWYGLAPPPG